MNLLKKQRLFTPGPTPLLPEGVLQSLVSPVHHRKEEFTSLFCDVQAGLQKILRTRNEILLLASSGSGAMEAAMVNILEPGESALIGICGKFGERWLELAERFGVEAETLQVPYGESVDPEAVAEALEKNPGISAVFIQATETSTGAVMDLEKIGKAVRDRANTVLVVDAITGLGTMLLETDAWGLDVVVGGSQKAFMAPPGVAMVSVSAKAWERVERCRRPRYYFDFLRERKGQRKGRSACTPAISIIQGLKSALDYVLAEGVDNFVANAALLAGATRAAVRAWGMCVLPRHPGNAVTAFSPPEGVDPGRVISLVQERFGSIVSGGQGSLKGKILRIGHLGYFDFLETVGLIGCLELAFVHAGASLELGSGPRAALQYYLEHTGDA